MAVTMHDPAHDVDNEPQSTMSWLTSSAARMQAWSQHCHRVLQLHRVLIAWNQFRDGACPM